MRSWFAVALLAVLGGCVGMDPATTSHPPLGEPAAMLYVPVQCNGNPWQSEGWDHADDRSPLEAERIVSYFASKNITVRDITFHQTHAYVCQSCSCPRGDWIRGSVAAEDVGQARALGWEYDANNTTTTST